MRKAGSKWDYELRPAGDVGYTGSVILDLQQGDVVTINFMWQKLYSWGMMMIVGDYQCSPFALDKEIQVNGGAYTEGVDYTIQVTALRNGQISVGTGRSNNVGERFYGRYINIKVN